MLVLPTARPSLLPLLLCEFYTARRRHIANYEGIQFIVALTAKLAVICKICGFHGGDYEECHLMG
jgi:hypothetical protein